MSGGNGFGKPKIERQDNLLIRVKDHTPQLVDESRETQDYHIDLPQALLENARTTEAGRFLLQLLSAVDHAGCGIDDKGRKIKRQPVMLLGWKNRNRTAVGHGKVLSRYVDGYTIFVTIPLRLKTTAPPIYAGNPMTGRV